MTTKPTVTREMIERVCHAFRLPNTIDEIQVVRDFALSALTDSGARGTLERLREQIVAEWKAPPTPALSQCLEVWHPHFLAHIDRELAALPPSPVTVAQPAEQGASEAWVGKLCEDSAKVDKEVEKWLLGAHTISIDAGTWHDAPHLSHVGLDTERFVLLGREINEAVRIMRTRAESLRAAERERDDALAQVEDESPLCRQQLPDGSVPTGNRQALELWYAQAGVQWHRAKAAEAELARLRAEMRKRDEAGSEFPMQKDCDALRRAHDEDAEWQRYAESLLLWCVRKMGGARG